MGFPGVFVNNVYLHMSNALDFTAWVWSSFSMSPRMRTSRSLTSQWLDSRKHAPLWIQPNNDTRIGKYATWPHVYTLKILAWKSHIGSQHLSSCLQQRDVCTLKCLSVQMVLHYHQHVSTYYIFGLLLIEICKKKSISNVNSWVSICCNQAHLGSSWTFQILSFFCCDQAHLGHES